MRLFKTTLFFSALLSTSLLWASNDYQLVIDAGSSGSRLHIFSYTQNNQDNVSVIQEAQDFSSSVKPGLSSFKDNPQAAGASLTPMLDAAKTYLAQHDAQANLIDYPITVLGTAGMRNVHKESPAKEQAIYDNVQSTFSTYGFTKISAHTMPDIDEGFYDWLTVNYLNKTFQENKTPVGIIDIGGASAEITFPADDNITSPNKIDFILNHKTYPVFSYNFLGLGQDDARANLNTNYQNFANACYPKDCVGTECKPTQTFNYSVCSLGYDALVQNYTKNNPNMQELLTQLPKKTDTTFYAFSSTYYDFRFFDVNTKPSLTNLTTQENNYCSSWDNMHVNAKGNPDKYLMSFCANGTFIGNLLFTQYQLLPSQMIVTNQIDGKDLDWTLGYVLATVTGNESKEIVK